MAKNTKYLVAANGTFNLRNASTGNSWCGRVRPDQEGVKATSREPKPDDKNCGRCIQLHDGASNAADKAVAATTAPKAGTGVRKVRKTAVKAVQTGDVGTLTVAVNDRLTPEDIYGGLEAWLAKNDIGSRVESDLANFRLSFDASGYSYDVIAPAWNANGPLDGWIIQYSADPSSADPTVVEDELKTDLEVVNWLADDLGLSTAGFKRPKPNPVADSTDTHKALMDSLLVSILSNAESAVIEARGAKMPQTFVTALGDLKDSVNKLRKIAAKK